MNTENAQADELDDCAEFGGAYLSFLDPVNEFAGRFRGIGFRTISSTALPDIDESVAAHPLGITDTRETEAVARVLRLGRNFGTPSGSPVAHMPLEAAPVGATRRAVWGPGSAAGGLGRAGRGGGGWRVSSSCAACSGPGRRLCPARSAGCALPPLE